MTDPCAMCGGTGKWGVPGKPCPVCGIFVRKNVYAPKWRATPKWIEVHRGPNNRERRAGLKGKGEFAYLKDGPKPGYEES